MRALPLAARGVFLALGLATAPGAPPDGAEWPSFRGAAASGVARAGQRLPATFDGITGANVRWKLPLPGLGHASPVVWGNRIYVATAAGTREGASFKPGLYVDGAASDDTSHHRWMVIAVDRTSGKVLWERVAFEGTPIDKRHVKSTYASATPATNGEIIVASFGSHGVVAYDAHGRKLWSRDLGRQNVGFHLDPASEWGPASSPVIWRDRVFLQVDTSSQDFVIALDAATGRTIWRTAREELPSWASPTVIEFAGRAELVTNASNFIRAYDPLTGSELWRLGGNSKMAAPTPFLAGGLIILTSGAAPERPIYAVRPGATGDISLAAGDTSNAHIAWSWNQRGSYVTTPLAYDGLLYVLSNQGVFDCYDLATGREVYRHRLPHAGSGFSASPVAADGRLYLAGEDGDISIVRAGRTFALETTSPMGEALMATPAIAGGMLLVRGERHLFAVGR